MKVLVYGNCQAGPIGRLIEMAAPDLEVIRIPPVHTLQVSDHEIVIDQFKGVDVILSQPIGDSFGVLSTASLQEITNGREWILFPSIYFSGCFRRWCTINKYLYNRCLASGISA